MKSIFQSKTFWWNFVTMIVSVATYYGYTPNQELSNQVSYAMLTASPIINIALRWVTTKGVRL